MKYETILDEFMNNLNLVSNSRTPKAQYVGALDMFRRYYEATHDTEWKVEDTTAEDVTAFMQELTEKRLRSPRVNRILHTMTSLYAYLTNQYVCSTDPTVNVEKISDQKTERASLTAVEYKI